MFFFLADSDSCPQWPATDQGDGYLPKGYLPKLGKMAGAAEKVYLADGFRITTIDLGSNYHDHTDSATDSYADYGAWRKTRKLNAYRTFSVENDIYLEPKSFRHEDGLNVLFFDGHIEYLKKGKTDDAGGYGSGARRASLWFPRDTDTSKLFSKDAGEPNIIVP
jgi:prepilin-type processing-associated H-X9-DG protein